MIEAIFTDDFNAVTASGLTQWDYGQELRIKGLTLPASFQVHFACKKLKEALVRSGTYSNSVGSVMIPDKMLEQDTDLTAWVYVANDKEGETVKTIYLPIKTRTKPSDFIYPPDEKHEEILDLAGRFEHIGELITEAEGNLGRIDGVVNEGKEAVADIRQQAALIGDGIVGEVTGSDITADGTFQGSAILKELKGGTKQEKTNGYQLFDASKIPSKTENGLTLTNNMDGTFTFNGTITNGGLYSGFSYTHEETLKLLKAGKIYIKDLVKNLIQVSLIVDEKEKYNIRDSSSSVNYTTIVQEDLDNPTSYLKIMFFKNEYEGTYNDVLLKPMLYQDGDGTWEPFTGGVPSPNPDYQQNIKSIGGNGWFDGEFDQGWISGSMGVDDDSVYVIHGYTKIPCKASDLVHLHYDETADYLGIALYKNDGTHLKNMSSGRKASRIDFVIPSGASYFVPQIQIDTGITVKNAKNLVVTVNGKYAVKVKTHGKNLFGGKVFKQKLLSAGGYEKDGGISITAERLQTITFFDNFKENTQYTIVLDGYNVSESNYDFANMTIYYTDGTYYTVRHGAKRKRTQNATKSALGKTIEKIKGSWNSGGNIFYPEGCGIFEGDITVEDFKPYKSSIAYIPLDSPLYEGDRIYLEDGELWEYRENARVVFDGSEDEVWTVQQYDNLCAYIGNIDMNILDNAETRKVLKCNKFKTHIYNISGNTQKENGIAIEGMNVSHSGFFFGIYGLATDVPTWRAWLQQNPVEVVYKLKTPTLKKLGSAEAFNLRTFDERTYIEVSNSKELGTENTFIVPRNQSGGLMTDAFATSKRNEINTANQANLASRISALEQLAVKESV